MEKLKLFEQLVNYATRAQVGVIDKNGKIKSTYVRNDGYLEGVGKVLKNHYDKKKINQIFKIDNGAGISSLGKTLDKPKGGFFNYDPNTTKFYGRDRGDKGFPFLTGDADNIRKYIMTAGDKRDAAYVYLYDERDDNWYYAKVRKDNQLKKL